MSSEKKKKIILIFKSIIWGIWIISILALITFMSCFICTQLFLSLPTIPQNLILAGFFPILLLWIFGLGYLLIKWI